MGFLKKLGKKLKKAAKKVAKVTPAGSTVGAAKAIKKGKLAKAIKGLNPAAAATFAKSGPGLAALKKTGSVDRAIVAGAKAGAAGAVVYGVGQATSGFMGSGGTVPAGEVGEPMSAQSGNFLDRLQGWSQDAQTFAGELGSTVGAARDLFTQFTGGGRSEPQAAPEPIASAPAPSGISTQTLLLIGGGVLLLLLVARKS